MPERLRPEGDQDADAQSYDCRDQGDRPSDETVKRLLEVPSVYDYARLRFGVEDSSRGVFIRSSLLVSMLLEF